MSEAKQEQIKRDSHFLRGNIAAELADTSTPKVSDESYELLKFFGSYQGYDRDTATERKKQKLDKEWEFMLRLKMPAGRLSAAQYLALDGFCDEHANGSLRITTRQTFQFHQIVKQNLQPFVQEITETLLTTLGGCGDVVRNITTCPAPIKDKKHQEMLANALQLAQHFAPKTEALFDIFVDGEPSTINHQPSTTEPLYGATYLPRKFKIGLCEPTDNCIDVLTNDVAVFALYDGQELQGYNIAIGGGMGMKHNTPATYPRLATVLAFFSPDELIAACEAVVKYQRDHGDREDRQHARLKYVVEERGIETVHRELAEYFGKPLMPARPMPELAIEEHMGWHEQGDGLLYLGIPIPSGRVVDIADGLYAGAAYRTALREIIEQYQMNLVLTPDQNIILCDIAPDQRGTIEAILAKHHIRLVHEITPLARHFHACVSLPTCGKALAEAERVEILLVDQLNQLFAKHGLQEEEIAIRIAGCPNGCSRPYPAEIGMVGRMPGHYVLYLGGDFNGTRLGAEVFDKVPLEQLVDALSPFLARFTAERKGAERFGDFVQRRGAATLKAEVLGELEGFKWAS